MAEKPVPPERLSTQGCGRCGYQPRSSPGAIRNAAGSRISIPKISSAHRWDLNLLEPPGRRRKIAGRRPTLQSSKRSQALLRNAAFAACPSGKSAVPIIGISTCWNRLVEDGRSQALPRNAASAACPSGNFMSHTRVRRKSAGRRPTLQAGKDRRRYRRTPCVDSCNQII